MKLVPLRQLPSGGTADLIKMVCETAQQGADVGQMRARIRVLDAVERNGDPVALALEDADHATLVGAVNAYRFVRMNQELLRLVDDILDAEAPPAPAAAAASEG